LLTKFLSRRPDSAASQADGKPSNGRSLTAPHAHVNQTRSPSTPPSSSPQRRCSWKKAFGTESLRITPGAFEAANHGTLVLDEVGVLPAKLQPRLSKVIERRSEDILLLAQHFLARVCAEYHLPPKSFAPDARSALLAYGWPGNVREVKRVTERSSGGDISS